MSEKATQELKEINEEETSQYFEVLNKDGIPIFPVGQIIFDINGEYANANLQDEGTAIFELYKEQVTRFSVLQKTGFKVMKVNFYNDIFSGFELVRSHLSLEGCRLCKESSFHRLDSTGR